MGKGVLGNRLDSVQYKCTLALINSFKCNNQYANPNTGAKINV